MSPDDKPSVVIRSSDCPLGSCPSFDNSCGLRTLSASQLGSLIVLLLVLIVLVAGAVSTALEDGTREPATKVQFWLIFAATALFYYLEECRLEEENCFRLRNLTEIAIWKLRLQTATLEFWLRVLCLICLGLAGAAPKLMTSFGFDGIDAGLIFLLLLYVLFLLWDLLVTLGGEVTMIWRLFWCDLLGAWMTMAYLEFRQSVLVTSLVPLLFIGIVLVQWNQVGFGSLLRRLGERRYLR